MTETNHRSTLGSALAYKDPRAAIEWLEKAFGFEPTMNEGIIEEEGAPADVFEHPKNERTQRFLSRILSH